MPGPAPNNKADFSRRWKNLEFGNRILMWDNLDELKGSGYSGKLTIRSRTPGGPCHYLMSVEQAIEMGAGYYYNEAAPDSSLVFQGELMHGSHLGGYYLWGSATKLPMRKALQSAVEYRGLLALGQLKSVCNPNGYDMLMELLDLYGGAVIEFGAYNSNLGVMPHNNVVIWEVRSY